MTDKFQLRNVRGAFMSVFKKAEYNGKETKYEGTFLLDKEDDAEQIALIKRMTKEALVEEFGSEDKIPKGILTEKNYCLRDGDNVSYDGFAGCMSLKASLDTQPACYDRNKTEITSDSGLLYSGSFVDIVVKLWVQNNNYGKKVNCNLLALRHRAHGPAFGAAGVPANVVDDFDDLEEDELDAMAF